MTQRDAPTPGRGRLIVGYAAIAAMLPYLTLKLLWILGSELGFTSATPEDNGAFLVANIATFALDLAGVGVALALTHSWGMRLPAWLVAFPMWVGAGFLAPIAVIAPVSLLADVLSGASSSSINGIVEPWVYAVVYTGFTAQGVLLLTAFVLYSTARWPYFLRTVIGDLPVQATHAVQVVTVRAVSIVAVLVSALHIMWAVGATAGLSPETIENRTLSFHIVEAGYGVIAFAGVVGVWVLVHRRARSVSTWVFLAAAWVGSGSMFSWGLFSTLVALSDPGLNQSSGNSAALLSVHSLFQLLAGVVFGVVGAFFLTEQAVSREKSTVTGE